MAYTPPPPPPRWNVPPPPAATSRSIPPPPPPAPAESRPAWTPPAPAPIVQEAKPVEKLPQPAAPFVPPSAPRAPTQQTKPVTTADSSTGRSGLLIGSAIGVVVVVGVGVFFAMKYKSASPQPTTQQTQETASPPAVSAPPAPAPAVRTTPENPSAQLAQSTQTAPPVLSSGLKLRQIGLALNLYAGDHSGKFPDTLDELTPDYTKSDILFDSEQGKPFEYRGKGKDSTAPNTDVMAYSSASSGKVYGVLKSGMVVMMTPERLAQANAEPPKNAQPTPSPVVPPVAVAPVAIQPAKDTRTATWSQPPPTASAPTPAPASAAPATAEVKVLDPVSILADCMVVVRNAQKGITPKLNGRVFEDRYQAKRFKYSGTIDSIKKSDGSVNFKSAGKWPQNYHVQAVFPSDKKSVVEGFKKGQQLTIEGELSSFALPKLDAGAEGLFGPSRTITVNQAAVLNEL